MYYSLPEPPLFLIFFGLFIGITSGFSFQETLKQQVKTYFKTPTELLPAQLETLEIRLPFLIMLVGICIFLAGGLEVFVINRWLSYGLSLPLTILTGALVWQQLGKLLIQLKQGGSKSIDLDSF
jgi:hypothetical protein